MEPMPKSLKLSGGTDDRLAVDRISNLPQELIGNILSFLPTKEALATSVLSTRWKWFWTFISCLKFYDDRKKDTELFKANFISYVYRVVFSRKPMPLNYFGITCHQEYSASHFRAWLYVVLGAGVKELDLSINITEGDRRVLPSLLYSCKSLVKLKLGGVFHLDVPPKVCLPNLEVLILNHIINPGDGSLNRLFDGCPALKEFESSCGYNQTSVISLPLDPSFTKLAKLKIGRGVLMDIPTLVYFPILEAIHLCEVRYLDNDGFRRLLGSCPLLRTLNVVTTRKESFLRIDLPKLSNLTILFRSNVADSKVILDTPSLQYLTVNGIAAKNLEVTDLNQLVEANIVYDVDLIMKYQVADTLIMAVSRVQTLHLGSCIMQVIARHGYELPMFQKLTTLKLGKYCSEWWKLHLELLEKTPILETLIFQEGLVEYPYLKNEAWFAPQRVPYCLIHHLKVIQVNHFRRHIEEFEMIKYFIENRGVANDLIIQHSRGSGEIWDTVAAEW